MPAETVSTPLALFLNTSAGAGEADKMLRLWQELVPVERQGPVFSVRDTATYDQQLDEALTFCETTGAVLAVAGGDGTFNGVVTRVVTNKLTLTLGLIPMGTFNFFARSHGIPEAPEAAIEFLLSAKPISLPLAYANDRPFFVSVSIGLHPKIIAKREAHTRYIGRTRLAAWLSGIWTIFHSRHLTRATISSGSWRRRITTPLLLVNFNSAQLFGLDHRFQYQPNKLAVLRLKPASHWHWSVIGFILRGLSGRVLDESSLECDYVDSLLLEIPRNPVSVALDGELVECQSPIKFRVQKQAFSCLLQGRAI